MAAGASQTRPERWRTALVGPYRGVLLLLVLSAVEARADSLAYLGVSVVDPVSLSVIATVPL